MGKYNHDKYLKEYKKNVLARVAVDMKKDLKEEIKKYADAAGESMAGYVKKAVEMRMAKEKLPSETKVVTVSIPTDRAGFGQTIADAGKIDPELLRRK